ncbi:MAG: glycosyl hydrolase family 18 protein [Acidobacteria bacterium]|nr:glycosyl hydrolase family 18 protein [Acidobacteriota bacterium]
MLKRRSSKTWSVFISITVVALLLIGVSAQQASPWAPNTSYAVGAQVSYQGSTYQCRQAHTSLQGWEPPNVPALWQLVTGGGGGGGGDTQAPSAPTNLRVTATTSSSISLAWNGSTDNVGVTGYDVFRGGTQIGTSPTTSFTATGLAAATTFSFTVRARDAAGNLSAASNAINATTQAGGGGTQPAPWAPNTSYAVAARVSYQGSIYECRQPHTSLVGWEPATTPALWLLVTGGGGGGGGDTQAPTAPGNLRVTATTSTSVSLAWNASSDNVGVTGYDVFQGSNQTPVGGTTTTTFTVGGLTPSTTYGFTVKAKDAAANVSTASNAVSATTQSGGGGGGGGGGALPRRIIVGYWHNFDNGSGFIRLRDVSRDFDVINVAFGEPAPGSLSTIQFVPDVRTTAAEVQADIAQLKGEGKKVLLSIGGANGHVELPTETDRQNFINSVTGIINQYGFNGIDVDFEGSSVTLGAGDLDFRTPTTPKIINLISALRTLANNFGPNFILSMAPETFFVQVGFQSYGGSAGAYLPVIHGIRDKLTYIHVQHYNTGSVLGLDGVAYSSANADFHVAMADMLLQGFPVGGNQTRFFPALRPDQVAIGLPASPQAAGSGYTTPAEVQRALNYLILGRSFGGRYVLRNPAGYPDFRGLMTWSINWDRFINFEFSRSHRAFLNGLP